MKLDLSQEDVLLLVMMLEKELGETRVEIHHCRTHDFKEILKSRERHIDDLLARLKSAQ